MSKLYKYNGEPVTLQKNEYRNNGTLAVCICSPEGELYDVVSVNLNHPMQSDSMAFLDENNNPGIGKWMEKKGLAVPMFVTAKSGFCTYNLYTIFPEKF